MMDVTEWMKAFFEAQKQRDEEKEKQRREEEKQRREEDKRRYEEEKRKYEEAERRREEEKRKYEEERLEERRRYEEDQKRKDEEAERRREEDRRRYDEELKRRDEEQKRRDEEQKRRDEAERRREEERRKEREDDRRKYEELIKDERRRYEDIIKSFDDKKRVAIGLETLKLKKLMDTDDIEAYLTTFERAAEAHLVEKEKWSVILAPQLTGKALQAYAALSNDDSKEYEKVKEAIFRRYNINEETYRQRFRAVKWKMNETPMEMVTRIKDLAEKWLKTTTTKEEVIDAVVKEQFIEVLPEEAKVWVKEHKPDSSQKAGSLAEDFRQARKKELWHPTKSTKQCHNCGKHGHLTKDCYYRQDDKSDGKKNDSQNEENTSGDGSTPYCSKCKRRGHTTSQCRKKALFCNAGRRQSIYKKADLEEQRLLCRGTVEGKTVKDIQLDTGCSRTVVRSDLIDKKKIVDGETITIQCAHGDTVSYPLAEVELQVEGRLITVEAAVSDTLPRSVLLGTDVPEMSELLEQRKTGKHKGKALVVMTRRQAKMQQEREAAMQQRQKESGARPTPIMDPEQEQTTEEIEDDDDQELPPALPEEQDSATDEEDQEDQELPIEQEEISLESEYNFTDDFFLSREGQDKERQTRAQKREARYRHARAQKEAAAEHDWVLNISKEELQRLQKKDATIQNLAKKIDKGEFFRRDGLLYRWWTPKQYHGEKVEQLVLPTQCRKTVLKMAHTIPFAGHMGRDKTARRIQQRFYWPTLFRDVADYCRRCPECQKTDTNGQQRVPLVPLPIMNEPFERIAMDIVGPLPRSRKGNQYILVICDYATRFPEAIPLRTTDAERGAEELIIFFQESSKKEISLKKTDGLVEKFNKALKALLRRLIKKEGRDWDTRYYHEEIIKEGDTGGNDIPVWKEIGQQECRHPLKNRFFSQVLRTKEGGRSVVERHRPNVKT